MSTPNLVRVYWDSHRGLYSVRCADGVRCFYKRTAVYLSGGCRLVVNAYGRDLVRRGGRKTPHAYVLGHPHGFGPLRGRTDWTPVRYRPETDDTFVEAAAGLSVTHASAVKLTIRKGRPCVLVSGIKRYPT